MLRIAGIFYIIYAIFICIRSGGFSVYIFLVTTPTLLYGLMLLFAQSSFINKIQTWVCNAIIISLSIINAISGLIVVILVSTPGKITDISRLGFGLLTIPLFISFIVAIVCVKKGIFYHPEAKISNYGIISGLILGAASLIFASINFADGILILFLYLCLLLCLY